jgi:23S rRNA (cytidine1920-2'-O)/16S rRNA (cytidine1409-2'-O)-methyltransferase
LADANKVFRIDFRGKTVLDLGSSTGGFTEYVLEQGASFVIAVELGTKQMKAPLRFDPRVKLHEKTDLFEFNMASNEKPDIIVVDVSFVSMRKILTRVQEEFVKPEAKVVAMLKPQFEASPDMLNKGVVKNDKIRREILKDFENWAKENGWKIVAKADNEVVGRYGNKERFYHLILS